MKIKRRVFLKTSFLSSLLFLTNRQYADSDQRRVILFGFDGVEPRIIQEMLKKQRLPNIEKLIQQGGIYHLTSTIPPQSPTAWSSFATCKNPGEHGIYDFLRRDPERYIPGVALGTLNPPLFDIQGKLIKQPSFENYRKGKTFWKIADEQGVHCKVLNMPYCFPPDALKNGIMLSGLGVPDIRGTESLFFAFSNMFTEEEVKETIPGGMRIKLNFDGDIANVEIPVVRNPIDKNKFITARITFKTNTNEKAIIIQTKNTSPIKLKEGQWSNWVEWDFPINDNFSIKAISRFFLREITDKVFIYMSCLQFHPRHPYVPFTNPPSYSAELADRYGLFKTIGWNYDTHALRQNVLTEEIFLEDVQQTMAWHEKLFLDELTNQTPYEIFIGMWMATDRMAHLFWRFRDPLHPAYDPDKAKQFADAIEQAYLIMDRIVGNTLLVLKPNDLFIVMSDHGFTTYRRGFNVATWLVREGYLVVEGQQNPETAYNEQPYLQGYDWKKTKAYALGLGSIYLNLEGREKMGIVKNTEADALREEIKRKLLEVRDPVTGEKIINNVYTKNTFKGIALNDAPDLIVGYREGYQSTKSAGKGSAPKELFEDNKDKWSGDHVATDYCLIPGLLVINKKLNNEKPHIQDIGVTILSYLGITPPKDLEGTSLI